GGTQDVMSVVEEAIKQGMEDACAGPICDPACVEQMIKAGVGNEVTLDLGGKVDMPAMGLKGKPLRVSGKVKAITDGSFVVTGPMATGTTVRMGRTAVLDTGKMQIVVSEKRAEPYDLGVFTHCGIDPRRKKYVLIKSRQHFRAGFEPIAKHIVMCDGDGCTASDLKLFKYEKVKGRSIRSTWTCGSGGTTKDSILLPNAERWGGVREADGGVMSLSVASDPSAPSGHVPAS